VTACCQVTTTWPDQSKAERAAATLVAEHLAACAHVVGPLLSTYRWQGSTETAQEWYCHFKTTVEKFPALQARVLELHPYEVPEIIALPILAGADRYLQWIRNEVKDGTYREPRGP
jgi:periplasmic divalent cation tolerance protein